MVSVYLDPGAKSDRVKGSFLPFVRTFFLIGNLDRYLGDMKYRVGGDLGVTAMLNRVVGLEMSIRLSKDRVTNALVYSEYSPIPDRKTRYGTTIQISMGLTGFL